MKRVFVRVLELVSVLLVLSGELGFVNAADSRKIVVVLLALLWIRKDFRQASFLVPRLKIALERLYSKNLAFWGIFSLGGLVALGFVLTKSFALGFSTFDTGIFHQLMWSLSQGLGFHSSISRAVDFLRDHLVLSLSLLSPLHALFDGAPPVTPVLSALLLFGGVLALFCAFRLHWKSGGTAFGLALLAVLLSQSLWANLAWGFHENHLGFFGICAGLAIWIRAGDRITGVAYFGSTLAFLIAAFSKESLLLQMGALFFLWGLLDPIGHFGERARVGRSVAVGLGAGLLACFVHYAKLPKHTEKNYFSGYFGYLGNSLDEVVLGLVTSPEKVISTVGLSPILWYLITLLVLGGFVFLLNLRARVNVLLIPLLVPVGMGVIAKYDGLRNPGMHYILEILPLLWFVSLWHLSHGVGKKAAPIVWAVAVLFLFTASPLREIRRDFKPALEFSELRKVLRAIPRDRIVMADAAPAVWISDRQWILTWWRSFEGLMGRCPELYVVYAPDDAVRMKRVEEMRALGEQCVSRPQKSFKRLESFSSSGFEFYEPVL